MLLMPISGPALTLAAMCALFGIMWTIALLVAVTGNRHFAEGALLATGAICISALVSAAGGVSSPVAAIAAALAFEAYWIARTRAALATGAAVAAVVVMLQALPAQQMDLMGPAAAGWHWLLPLLYAATVWQRRASFGGDPETGSDSRPETSDDPTDGVWLKLAPAGEVVACQGASKALLGLDADLLQGNGLLDRIQVADRVAFLCAISEVLDKDSRHSVELRLRLPCDADAGLGYRPFSLALHKPESGEKCVVGVLRDNAEIETLRLQLSDTVEKAESSNVAKNRFLATVSHELRTPLNSIIGFSEVLLNGFAGELADRRQAEYVRLIHESGNHLLSVVNSILDASKIESGTYAICAEPFAFEEALELTGSMLEQQALARGVSFSIRACAPIGQVVADRRAIQQVLINLVSNAIKFTPEGGNVILEATRLGNTLQLRVMDNGIGIAEADLKRIGEPFVQVQNDLVRQYDGAGLGLSIVTGLVRLHHGAMAVESAAGEGTTVTVTIPTAQAATADDAASNIAALVHREDAIEAGESNEPFRKIA